MWRASAVLNWMWLMVLALIGLFVYEFHQVASLLAEWASRLCDAFVNLFKNALCATNVHCVIRFRAYEQCGTKRMRIACRHCGETVDDFVTTQGHIEMHRRMHADKEDFE